MAGDWIKMSAGLRTHPKVVRISSALNADRLRVVGGLHAVWCLFDEHSEDGKLDGYSADTVDELIGWSGFTNAMVLVGWAVKLGESLVLPEFETHNGQSAKRRAMEADRKREARKTSAPEADKKRTREEKNREEKKDQKQKKSAPSCPDDVHPQTWDDWLSLRKAKRAPVTETVLKSARDEAIKASMPLNQFLTIWCARGSQGLEADWIKPHERGASHETNRDRSAIGQVEQAINRNREARGESIDGTAIRVVRGDLVEPDDGDLRPSLGLVVRG